jgi:hypothetical protein
MNRGARHGDPIMAPKPYSDPIEEIRLRYGFVSVGSLREIYRRFAPHCADSKSLGEILSDLDIASLTQILRDFKSGRLEEICQPRAGPKRESHGHPGNDGDNPF